MRSRHQGVMRRFWLGAALLGILLVLVAFAPVLAPYDIETQDPAIRLLSPCPAHPMGTDRFGRDIFSRVLFGGRTTLLAAFATLLVTLVTGALAGAWMGLRQNTVADVLLMRLMDTLMAFPFLVFAMLVASLWGRGMLHLLTAMAAVGWVPFARVCRSMVIQLREETSVEAARVLGASLPTILFREILPNVLPTLLIQATFACGELILSLSALSFLGLGAQPPSPEWGSMMSDGRAHFFQAPHVVLCPALFVVCTVLALNLIGESFRDRLDPYEAPDR